MPSCLIHVEDSHVGLREIMTGTVKELIQTYMAAFAVGDTATIEHCFHKDAKIVGKQDGVFVATDRATFVSFLESVGLGQAAVGPCQVEPIWEDRQEA